MERKAQDCDRACDRCNQPMIGIMVQSDYNGYRAPRTICVHCERWPGEGLGVKQKSK